MTSTEPGTPGCLLKSVVSTVTSMSEQPICWLAMLAVAASRASLRAVCASRASEAERAPSAAADLERLVGARRSPAEDDQADEEREGGYADRRLDRGRTALVTPAHGVLAAVGSVSRSTGTVALWRDPDVPAGDHAQAEPGDGHRGRCGGPAGLVEVPVSTSSPPASAMKSLAAPTPSDSRPCSAAGGSGALLRGRDRDRSGVVEERGLHPQEHDREERGQQDHELDRHRAPLDRAAGERLLDVAGLRL